MLLPGYDASRYRLINLNIFDYIIKLFKGTFFLLSGGKKNAIDYERPSVNSCFIARKRSLILNLFSKKIILSFTNYDYVKIFG